MKPMLSQVLPTHRTPQSLIDDPDWIIQQKLDGERLLVEIKDRECVGFNRQGIATHVPTHIAAEFDNKGFSTPWTFDGEIVGDKYYLFDCLKAAEQVNTRTPAGRRFDLLKGLFKYWHPTNVAIIPYAEGKFDKVEFFDKCFVNHAEGVVFKHTQGTYTPGARTMASYKHKFVETADVVVSELNREGHEQGISIQLFDSSGEPVHVGGCKIPAEAVGRLQIGDVIEVKYLYASENDKLVQPTWVRPRFDKTANECKTSQLKHTSKEVIT